MESLQIGLIVIKYDKANITRLNITDVETRKLARVEFRRGATHLLTVIIDVAVLDWKDGAFPPPQRVTQVKGLTEMEIQ